MTHQENPFHHSPHVKSHWVNVRIDQPFKGAATVWYRTILRCNCWLQVKTCHGRRQLFKPSVLVVDSLHTERRSFSNLLPRLLFWCLLSCFLSSLFDLSSPPSLASPLLIPSALRPPVIFPFFLTSSLTSSLLFHILSPLFAQPHPGLFSSSLLFLSRPFPILLSFRLPFSLCPLCLSSPVPLQRDCSQNPLTFIPRRRYITILKKLSCVKGNPASDRSRCLQGFTLIWPRLGRPACLVFMRLMRSWKPFVEMLHKAAAVE